ncbi:FAD/NAD(P)-binding domain-containing protein [Mycena maculata]|uniref:FAD/NAD(P)-binding domain-containing protein n=1 Tax=Mycena maculata TaxID=230809 RepID=A0AAD7JG53_9AGAR|nr:FAD/NAD(P)-binding domain-containing protein [Mycena maculata]
MSLAALFTSLFVVGHLTVSATTQIPFQAITDAQRSHLVNSPVDATGDSQFYEFKWPIRKVAIIGAGVRWVTGVRREVGALIDAVECSGLLAYRELIDAGFEKVKIFERDAVPGGNWHYTDELPLEAPIPNLDPKIADYEPSLPSPDSALPFEVWYADHNDSITTAERWRRHRAPHAVWKSLTSNVPAPHMHFNGHDWPPGTPWNLPHALLTRYLRGVYSFYGINSNDKSANVTYSTRVELVEKRIDAEGIEQGWQLTLKKFIRLGPSSSKEVWWTEDFDAVVIATGTFNAPNIPNIPGLAEWKHKFPGSILHSREYRYPEKFANQSLLVVGAGTSATGISADLNLFVKRNYLSLRRSANSTTPTAFLNLLPQGVDIVVGIERFHPSNATIELSDGTLLADIDHILFSTGYQYTFPFLPQYHNSSIGLDEEGPEDRPQPLVTDGSHYRSLYREFIYIEEPTLAFMNMNLGAVTWTFGEYFAVAIAKIWSGTARLPNQAEMWKSYRERVAASGGYGKKVLYLPSTGGGMSGYIAFFMGWLNSAAYEFGGKTIDGLNKDFFEQLWVFQIAFFANPNPVRIPESNHSEGFIAASTEQPSPVEFLDYLTSGY